MTNIYNNEYLWTWGYHRRYSCSKIGSQAFDWLISAFMNLFIHSKNFSHPENSPKKVQCSNRSVYQSIHSTEGNVQLSNVCPSTTVNFGSVFIHLNFIECALTYAQNVCKHWTKFSIFQKWNTKLIPVELWGKKMSDSSEEDYMSDAFLNKA